MAPSVVVATTLLYLAAPNPTNPWSKGYRVHRGRIHVPIEAAVRPTTLPADQFEIRIQSQVVNTETDLWRVPLEATAGYGVSDDVEIGIRLLRLRLTSAQDSDTGGLIPPSVFVKTRGVIERLEVGAFADLELPLEGFKAFDFGAFSRFHLGQVARIDLGFRIGLRYDEDQTTWPVQMPTELLINLSPFVAIAGGMRVEWFDIAEVDLISVRPTGRLLYVIGDCSQSPLWQLEAFIEGNPTRQPDPWVRTYDIEQLSVGLRLVMFFDDPSNSSVHETKF